MRTSALTPELIQRLVDLHTDGHPVLSLYMTLDPVRAPHLSDRRSELNSLLTRALAQARDRGEQQAADEIERMRRSIGQRELAVQNARGLALFRCAQTGLLEAVRIPTAVEPAVRLQERAFVEPLVGLIERDRWCVLLCSSRMSRVFLGNRYSVWELLDIRDAVHRRHSQGGWSQPQFQRGVEKEIDEHARNTCAELAELYRRSPFEHLVHGGPPEMTDRLARHLLPQLRQLLEGQFDIDVERASASEVHSRVLPNMLAHERRVEEEACEELDTALAPNGLGVSGLKDTLRAISEHRAARLLIGEEFHVGGFSCPRCGLLSSESDPCPNDGTALREEPDVLETAIERALGESCEVLILRHCQQRLQHHGSIGALLRY